MIKEIRITRRFLKKPVNNVILLLSIALLIEAIAWSIGYIFKLKTVDKLGGPAAYLSMIVRSLLIPELVTLLITNGAVNYYHQFKKLTQVHNNWLSLTRYELQFLPILALAFPFFNPFTQTTRFLLEQYPNYSWDNYYSYILKTYSWPMYFTYLAPVLLINYLSLNISLFQDFVEQRRDKAKRDAIEEFQQTIPQPQPPVPAPTYLSELKGRNSLHELTFSVQSAYFFTIQERVYYAQLDTGFFMITKTLNELEAELDPGQFFRIKRDYIVNRRAILGYTHWENGKYIVRIDSPVPQQITIPRARMQELREWLQKPGVFLLPPSDN